MKRKLIFFIIIFSYGYFECKGQSVDSLFKVSEFDHISCEGRFQKRPVNFKPCYKLEPGVIYTDVANNYRLGFSFEAKWFISKKLSIGGVIQYIELHKMTNSFGYDAMGPVVASLNISWINEYLIYKKGRHNLDIFLTNGINRTNLYDESVKVINPDKTSSNDSIMTGLASNFNFNINPGMTYSFELFSSVRRPLELFIYGKAGYRQILGKCNFGNHKDFSGLYYSLGLKFLFKNDSEKKYVLYKKMKN